MHAPVAAIMKVLGAWFRCSEDLLTAWFHSDKCCIILKAGNGVGI